mmetsp:Transcript_20668/g.48248  ORF Transcript_20668/g.48248 Transcript_20668/m.48248 type:complete len:557 (+) Transcript_20668:3-1673(+)
MASVSVVAGLGDSCLEGLGYGTPDQRGLPQSNVPSAGGCQASCRSTPACKFFTFDTSSSDCWLLSQELFFSLDESVISGPVQCKGKWTEPPTTAAPETSPPSPSSSEPATTSTPSVTVGTPPAIVSPTLPPAPALVTAAPLVPQVTSALPTVAHVPEVSTPAGVANESQEGTAARRKEILAIVTRLAKEMEVKSEDARVREEAKKLRASAALGVLSAKDFETISMLMTQMIKMHEGPTASTGKDLFLTTDELDYLAKMATGAHTTLETEASSARAECTSGACDDTQQYGSGTAWTNAEVKYCLDPMLAYGARDALDCAIGKIKTQAPGIKFTDVGYKSQNACHDSVAIYVQSNNVGGAGCWAHEGMQSGLFAGNQKLNLQYPGCHCGVAIHEMLHAMGMAHEQNRPDRNQFLNILWQNIKPEYRRQYDISASADTGWPYDILSIMHYGPWSFSVGPDNDNYQTMVLKPEAYQLHSNMDPATQKANLGQRSGMTDTDASQLRALYGCDQSGLNCKPTPSTSVLVPVLVGVGVLLALGCLGAYCFCRGRQKKRYQQVR